MDGFTEWAHWAQAERPQGQAAEADNNHNKTQK